MNYLRARTVEEALARLARHPQPRIVCGATDVFADADLVPSSYEWLDISRIDALRVIERRGGIARIGAACTWEAIARVAWLPAALTQASACVGSRQIRVQGTIGGNLCHASPVADGVPALLVLDAQVELASARGVRRLPLAQFFPGGRRTALQSDELLVAVLFALPGEQDRTAFIKCGNRDGPTIAVVSAAARLRVRADGAIQTAAVAVGGASERVVRMHAVETLLAEQPFKGLTKAIEAASLSELAPIDDCRATASHRLHLARLAIRRVCAFCIEESPHGASTA
ncbi:FAD binding domain-containing protein [Trinickia caryophylli]|uniref:CO or xanthine dehydrogenase, FAD-binding subunit n=1 Tax=Trinickia caryophylli TaxID=28094 RepID=A0A1X7EP53_TRICW|nr:FAD binding domain-containing protein [Trinickia caryophylli]PMS10238.1 molybdopterin dehydrogenase [Trinickia caryophylli]TRX18708.1 molybdopterin dehydrogenase [Trinickia caryophylli]WQE10494.1 FAD binding domain-containing protein [Trinickia caryophylli]SMF37591.1 CO or xanthine dehydrogenase, FAD-binding subunit [Trinickia caryophylli]GLU32848.1 xanthine dehydrogenase [Trinickia caryophylli]